MLFNVELKNQEIAFEADLVLIGLTQRFLNFLVELLRHTDEIPRQNVSYHADQRPKREGFLRILLVNVLFEVSLHGVFLAVALIWTLVDFLGMVIKTLHIHAFLVQKLGIRDGDDLSCDLHDGHRIEYMLVRVQTHGVRAFQFLHQESAGQSYFVDQFLFLFICKVFALIQECNIVCDHLPHQLAFL